MTVQQLETAVISYGPRDGHIRQRQVDREGRTLARRALDGEPRLVARQDVLDDGETEAGSPLGPALRHVDAVEPLGQARQVLRRDAGAEIPYTDDCLGRTPAAGADADLDPLAGGAVFQRVLHEVLEHAAKLIAVSERDDGLGRRIHHDVDAAVARQHLHGVGNLSHDGDEIDFGFRTYVDVELDARKRQEIVDEPRHAERLLLHDRQEAFARRRV